MRAWTGEVAAAPVPMRSRSPPGTASGGAAWSGPARGEGRHAAGRPARCAAAGRCDWSEAAARAWLPGRIGSPSLRDARPLGARASPPCTSGEEPALRAGAARRRDDASCGLSAGVGAGPKAPDPIRLVSCPPSGRRVSAAPPPSETGCGVRRGAGGGMAPGAEAKTRSGGAAGRGGRGAEEVARCCSWRAGGVIGTASTARGATSPTEVAALGARSRARGGLGVVTCSVLGAGGSLGTCETALAAGAADAGGPLSSRPGDAASTSLEPDGRVCAAACCAPSSAAAWRLFAPNRSSSSLSAPPPPRSRLVEKSSWRAGPAPPLPQGPGASADGWPERESPPLDICEQRSAERTRARRKKWREFCSHGAQVLQVPKLVRSRAAPDLLQGGVNSEEITTSRAYLGEETTNVYPERTWTCSWRPSATHYT